MRLVLSIIAFCTSLGFASGQSLLGETLESPTGWGEGVIVLNDGKELKGLVRYNDKTGILNYENGKDSRSLISRNVLGFEYDDGNGEHRVFYSIMHEDMERNVKTPLFFEVLRQFEDFAILTRWEPVTAKMKNNWYNETNTNTLLSSDKVTLIQLEMVYFMHSSGTLDAYLEIIRKEVNKATFDRSVLRTRIVDKDVLEKYTGNHYAELRQYSKKNKLDLDEKEDLLKLFDYYRELVDRH